MASFASFDHFFRKKGTRKKYELKEALIWEVGAKGSDWELVLAPGLSFDISVPRYLEWAQDPHDKRVLLAALIHDELLRRGFDVSFASAEFRRALVARGVPKHWAWLLFALTLIWTAIGRSFKSKSNAA